MTKIENMNEIERVQNDIGLFLISAMPVPWKKICFYAECDNGCVSTWFAFEEEKTGIISTMECFWIRYNNYPVNELDVNIKLSDLARLLYNSYVKEFGESKKWHVMFYTVESDGSVKIDFEYEMPKGNFVEIHHNTFKRFFGTDYEYIEGKYPY